MIQNKLQYEITQKHRRDFSAWYKHLEEHGAPSGVAPMLHAAHMNGLLAQMVTFDGEIAQWEARSAPNRWLITIRYSIECFFTRMYFLRLHGIRTFTVTDEPVNN